MSAATQRDGQDTSDDVSGSIKRQPIGPSGFVVTLRPERMLLACAVRGMSLTRLAEEARLSLTTVRTAAGGRPIRPRTAYRIASALERIPVPPDADELLQPF
jgi:hypothetical protein